MNVWDVILDSGAVKRVEAERVVTSELTLCFYKGTVCTACFASGHWLGFTLREPSEVPVCGIAAKNGVIG